MIPQYTCLPLTLCPRLPDEPYGIALFGIVSGLHGSGSAVIHFTECRNLSESYAVLNEVLLVAAEPADSPVRGTKGSGWTRVVMDGM